MNSPAYELPDKLLPFIWQYLRNKKRYLAGFTFVAIMLAAEISLNPYLLKVIINTVIQFSTDPEKMLTVILIPTIIYIACPLIVNLNLRLFQYINLRLYPDLKASIGKDVFTYLMNHSHDFFLNTHTGSLVKKIGDLIEIELLISTPVEFYFRFIALLIACITLFLSVNPIFGIILFLWATLFIYFSYIAAKNSEKYSRIYSEAGARVGGTISDSIVNIMSTKLFGNISEEVSNVEKDIDNLVKRDRELQWYIIKISFWQGIAITLLIALMITGLIYGRIHGWVSVGDFALVLSLSMAILQVVYGIGQLIQKFAKVVGTYNQSLSFVRVPHRITDIPGALPIKITKGQINFNSVSFHYDKHPLLFDNLTIAIRPGEKVGLVGYSGGGKSTFIKLILRLFEPQSGEILIDGQTINTVQKTSLRKQISMIPQECELFHRTLMENIRFAKKNATDAEVINAAKKAHCHEFISQLPEQYQSLVGERGVKLSGGQKQRIAIARAFLKDAPILLLDEATSALDSLTEGYIQESLHDVMIKKTTLVIAHRLSTLKDMDRILVFVHGKIVEDGDFNSLLSNKESHFYKLWQMQAEGFIYPLTE